jgi:hypothetical protein
MLPTPMFTLLAQRWKRAGIAATAVLLPLGAVLLCLATPSATAAPAAPASSAAQAPPERVMIIAHGSRYRGGDPELGGVAYTVTVNAAFDADGHFSKLRATALIRKGRT